MKRKFKEISQEELLTAIKERDALILTKHVSNNGIIIDCDGDFLRKRIESFIESEVNNRIDGIDYVAITEDIIFDGIDLLVDEICNNHKIKR